jgi:N-carbamoyl-L-amino-acid hydrolase
MNDLKIDIAKLSAELFELAKFSDVPNPDVTRVMLSDTDLAARKYLIELFRAAGLQIRIDAAGNIFSRWQGSDAAASAIATGSHTDAIPHSGMYDGTVGVLGGLEAIRSLQRANFKPRRSIELIMFTSEEPTRYGVGCLGSRLMSGNRTAADAAKLVDSDGVSFGDFHRRAGGEGTLDDVRLKHGHYQAFVELHIEQGPLLEQAGVPIGVVKAIAAPGAFRVIYEGAGGHAGAVLMPERRDALLPAAKLALDVDAATRTLGGPDTVATTGVLDVYPRAINSIPSRTLLEIDVRDIELARRDKVFEHLRRQAQLHGDEHRQTTTIEVINRDPPTTCDPQIVATIEKSSADAGLKCQQIISRAYHDSSFMAQICPTAIIFIPCRNGYSHRPEEYSSSEEIAAGVEVLARTLAQLSQT